MKDVVCEKAERKKSRSESKPGVIIAKMKSFEDKRKVMFEKKSLKNHSIYSNVFIQHDQAQADRVLANNFRAILGAIKSHGLTVRGSRIVPRGSSERADSPRDRASGDGNRNSGSGNRDNRYDNRQSGSRDGSPRRDQDML
ncbi:hypothetical protein DPMN_178945 [Dreissena polymorpha]|uniref:Uncharacterized protein n=1 Tax=Dreissena polymorpha TaxID=45954 RepID=A0A9D4IN22_DREPO|nr:hypothetical protein DPMN_178945 [Dreissena polymorpha]